MNTHTETKHTPGPLAATEMHNGDWEISKDGDVLATVHGDDNDPLCWPAGANARLFAAAPELLEALRAVLPLLDIAFSYEGDVFGSSYNAAGDADDQARAAIAKAMEGAQ